jgi:uncharacterized protein
MSTDADVLVPTMLDSEPISPEPIAPESSTAPRPEPVAAHERVVAVDMLRGFALLGILAMNITAFSWPEPAYDNPTRIPGTGWFDRAIWAFNHLFFDMKMMTLFSMLFGAGLVLMTDRSEKRGTSLRGVYYRRVGWLLVIGLIHAYLIWWGDILVMYAECGFLIYLFRRLRPRTLIALGVLFMLVLVPFVLAAGAGFDFLKATAAKAEAAEKAGKKPTKFQAWIQEVWTEKVLPGIDPNSPKKKVEFEKEIKIYRGGYLGMVKSRATQLVWLHTLGFVFGIIWMLGGRMLLGMGLMKLGVFSGRRSRGFYIALAILGYGIGLPLIAYDTYALLRTNFGVEYQLHGGVFFNFYGSILVAFGHVGALMLIFKAGLLTWLTTRLAAVGRMALTNYLSHSIVCTTLFYGYGFGLFAKVRPPGLVAIVLSIWIVQLLISPLWLARFRFGPAEWLWRSLTYWKPQPILRRAEMPPT